MEPRSRSTPAPRPIVARMATNAAVQVAGGFLGSAISLVTFAVATRGLGPEAFGNYTAALVFLFIPVVLADIGLSTTVLRTISASPERTQPVVQVSLGLRTIVAAVVVLVAVGIGVAAPFNSQTTTAILIGSVGAFLNLVGLSFLPVLQAKLKMHLAVAANLAGRLATLVLTVAALAGGLGLSGVVIAYVLGIAVTALVQGIAVGRLVSLRPRVDLAEWRSLLRASFALGLAIGLGQVFFRVDTLLLALLRSAHEVGLYGATYKVMELSEMVAFAIVISAFPTLALFVETRDERAAALVGRTFDVLIATAAPICVLMLVVPETIVVTVAGDEYRDGAVALQILAPSVILLFTAGLLWRILIAGGKGGSLLALVCIVLALNLALNAAVIPAYGFKGAATTTVLSDVVGVALLAAVIRKNGYPLPTLRYVPVVAGAALAMAGVVAFSPAPTGVGIVVGGLVYAALVALLRGTVRDALVRDVFPLARRVLLRT